MLEFKKDKCRIGYCYFEQKIDYIEQPLDDTREFKPKPMPKLSIKF